MTFGSARVRKQPIVADGRAALPQRHRGRLFLLWCFIPTAVLAVACQRGASRGGDQGDGSGDGVAFVNVAAYLMAALYVLLSIACLAVSGSEDARTILNRSFNLLWLLGPPALLLHGYSLLVYFLSGTLLLFGIGFGVRRSWQRYSAWSVVLVLVAAFVWSGFGLLFYAPTV